MELQELEELLRELLEALEFIMQSGEELNDELQGEIARTLEKLYDKIEQLRGESPTVSPVPQMTPSMPSSNVEGFSYDDENNRLYVRFLGDYPNRNGPIYSYENVPPVIFELFKRGSVPARTDGKNKWGTWWKGKVPSIGASVYGLLKLGGFPYAKVA